MSVEIKARHVQSTFPVSDPIIDTPLKNLNKEKAAFCNIPLKGLYKQQRNPKGHRWGADSDSHSVGGDAYEADLAWSAACVNLGLIGFRVWGLGFGVWGLGVRVWGLGFRAFRGAVWHPRFGKKNELPVTTS